MFLLFTFKFGASAAAELGPLVTGVKVAAGDSFEVSYHCGRRNRKQ